MKKIFILGLIVIGFWGNSSAATYTWSLTTSGNANSAASWTKSGGGTGIPGASDDVIFDGTSTTNCNWDILTIGSFSVLSGYTGVISMASGLRQIRGNFVVNSGTVNATSGTFSKLNVTQGSVFSVGAGGTFNHSNGTFLLNLDGGDTYTFSGNVILNNFTMGLINNAGERIIAFGTNLVVSNFSLGAATDEISFQGTIHITSTLNLLTATYSNTLIGPNNANFIFDGSTATIIGAVTAGSVWLPNITMSATTSYALSNNLNVQGNWTYAGSGAFTSGSSNVNFYGTSATINGPASFDNVNLQSGSSVTFPGATEILIGKNFSVATGATAVFSAGSVLGFNGSSQTISGSFSPQGITVHSGITTLGNAMSLIDVLIVESGATFASGGLLTLPANSGGSARVGTSTGTISGNVTVETFLPGGNTDWANLGIRGVQSQPVSSWDTYVSSGGANGIPMTCTGCFYDPSQAGNFTSIQGWDESTNGYDASLTASSPLTPGQGFWVYVGNGSTTTTDLKLVNTGSLVQGAVGVNITSNGPGDVGSSGTVYYNLIANPYPSPISWGSVLTNNGGAGSLVNDAIYAYNADQFGYASYVNGSSVNGLDDNIPGGQGFYVEDPFSFNNATLTFDESDKVGTTNPIVKPSPSNYGQRFKLKLIGSVDHDEAAFRIHPEATQLYDGKWDAHKFFQSPGYMGFNGPYTKYTTISSKDPLGDNYSINSVPSLTEDRTIPVLVRVSTSGTYTIHAYDYKDYTGCVGLMDNLTGTFHDLKQSDYVFTISDTTSKPRFDLVLCRDASLTTGLTQQVQNSGTILINQDQQGAYVKTAFSRNTKATISAYNLMGQKLIDDMNVEGTTTSTRLNLNMQDQVVIIRVVTDKECSTKKMVMH